ncbi:MAG: bifunctional diaminohydroxyphosphoribosylaminopyrimidine deaminase/5-amino-6-(5-phosphoribosylamino)uracil reductase RibD [Pseudomonadota bacterium]
MDDAGWMRHALALAARGLGQVWPNPAVGCVIVAEGRILGEGWTQPGGRPHAETVALAAAGRSAAGATAFVTLEPCAHSGETGPCARHLAEAGVARVVFAHEDPDPRVSGRGREILRSSGVDILEGVGAADARRLNAGFLSRIEIGRPRLTLKLAQTLDGRIATETGESRWITGPPARTYVHGLRANHDAILIGVGTAQADNPQLDVRHVAAPPRPPVRVVVDARLSLPLTSRLVATARDVPLWLVVAPSGDPARRAAFESAGVRLIDVDAVDGRIHTPTLMQALGSAGLTRVLCEGGGRLSASLLKAGLVDELAILLAGKVFGAEGVPAIGGLGLAALADAPRFDCEEVRPIGSDILTRWVPSPP